MFYGFNVWDAVKHVKDDEVGIVTEIDSDADLGGVTTCRVAWGVDNAEDARKIAQEDTSIHWTNKLYKV